MDAYDVFVSYSSKDRSWVRGELVPTLERNGLRVLVDYRDFEPGAPSVSEMERGLSTSRKTVLVLTPAYLASAWTEFEASMLQALDPANRARRLIPLLKEPCELPLRIGYLTWVDFTEPAGEPLAWQRLLKALAAAPAAGDEVHAGPVQDQTGPGGGPGAPAPRPALPYVVQVKIKAMEERLATLVAQYEAASRQADTALDAAAVVKLRGQLAHLEQEMAEVERELESLKSGGG